jgi:hypothetical protein
MVRAVDVDPVLPPSIVKNIGDKLYEKRKAAALEVEQVCSRTHSICFTRFEFVFPIRYLLPCVP